MDDGTAQFAISVSYNCKIFMILTTGANDIKLADFVNDKISQSVGPWQAFIALSNICESLEPTQVEHVLGAQVKGQLSTLPANFRPGWKDLPVIKIMLHYLERKDLRKPFQPSTRKERKAGAYLSGAVGPYSKRHILRNLRLGQISQSVYSLQAFPTQCYVTPLLIWPIFKLRKNAVLLIWSLVLFIRLAPGSSLPERNALAYSVFSSETKAKKSYGVAGRRDTALSRNR